MYDDHSYEQQRVWLPAYDNGALGGWSERQSQESVANHAGTIHTICHSQEAEEVQLYAIRYLPGL